MVSKCPSCGGELRFDIEDQMVVCDSCGRSYSTADLLKKETDSSGARKASAKAKEVPEEEEPGSKPKAADMKVTVFTCPNCGGEIISTDLDAVDYCSYCGSFVSLESHLTKMREPDYVVPFKVTGEECRSSYKRFAKKRLYAPSRLRNDEFLERFRSIYIPYWMYEVGYGPGELTGRIDTTRGNYVYHKKYSIELDMDASIKHIPFDASSTFDDSISEAILPYDPEELEPFSEAALLGHFADTADVPPRTYEPEARQVADHQVWEILQNVPLIQETEPNEPSYTEFSKTFGREVKDTRLAMLPVWFLTWRKKDRVAYSVVNGATGEISAEVPISIGKFLLGTLICAIPLFLIFNLLFMITAPKMMIISSLLTCIGVILYFLELKEIAKRETHVYDKGYLTKHREEKKRSKELNVKKKTIRAAPVKISDFFKEGSFFVAFVAIWICFVLTAIVVLAVQMGVQMVYAKGLSGGFIALLTVCDIIMVVAIKRACNIAKIISYRKIIPDVIWSLIALALAHFVVLLHPAEDLYYYVTAAIGLLGVVMTMLGIIRRYNAVVTRPLPHFFERTSNEGEKASKVMAVFIACALLIGSVAVWPMEAQALDLQYHNDSTGFDAVIIDDADLLSDSEEAQLLETMKANTEFGNAVFLSSDEYVSSTSYLAGSTYTDMYGSDSGSIFVVDMYNRYLYIYSDGLVYQYITKGYANTITDNVYKYASDGDYFTCAREVFKQELNVLNGIRIAQPMKYVDNLLLALIGSLFINYMLLRIQSRRDKVTQEIMMASSSAYLALISAKYFHKGTTKSRVQSSSGGGGGSSGGGGGGGGGGGFSGGGGGHGF